VRCAAQRVRRRGAGIELGGEPRQARKIIARLRRTSRDFRDAPRQKIRQQEPPIHRHEHVLGAHVTVHDTLLVRIDERRADRAYDVVGLIDLEMLRRQVRQHFAQGLAVEPLAGHVILFTIAAEPRCADG
jgi:hypothetical protein